MHLGVREAGPNLTLRVRRSQQRHIEAHLHSEALNVFFAELDVVNVKCPEQKSVGLVEPSNSNRKVTASQVLDERLVRKVSLGSVQV